MSLLQFQCQMEKVDRTVVHHECLRPKRFLSLNFWDSPPSHLSGSAVCDFCLEAEGENFNLMLDVYKKC